MQEVINKLWKLTQNQLEEVNEYIDDLLNPKKKRSLNANSYFWKLITEIANMLKKSKEDVYKQMLNDYGQSEIVSILSSISPDGYFKYYEKIGSGIVNGKEFTHYKIFKGSSEYNTKEMSILIDGTVQEAKQLGIRTLEDIELERLVSQWKQNTTKKMEDNNE